jgi:hypothetical protein
VTTADLLSGPLSLTLLAAGGALLLALVALVVAVVNAVRVGRWRRVLRTAAGTDLERLLLDQQRWLREVDAHQRRLDEALHQVDVRLGQCLQHPALIRFNAFANTGSDLSFALALLDAGRNGVVLSSVFGRDEARVYAKPVAAGRSTYPLTEEEMRAINQAGNRTAGGEAP